MGSLIRLLLPLQILRPLLRPLTRFIVGLIAIPLFRAFLKRVVALQELDQELEKDLEEWFRGSLLLLVATANMEAVLFDWVPLSFQERYGWVAVGLRLLLAIGVIEAMPDQALFAVIHPGPPKLKWPQQNWLQELRVQIWPQLKGLACQHLNRSSPVFAIMAAIFGGPSYERWLVGWICYALAITQYLIIGLVTSRDKALDALAEFDKQVAIRRRELIEEFDLEEHSQRTAALGESPATPGAVPAADPAENSPHPESRPEDIAKQPNAGYVSDGTS